jgi:sec-independent protein translocase protein TatA
MALFGWPELILILVILVFLFGATKMKDFAKGIGEGVKEFRTAVKEPPSENNDEKKETIINAAEKMGIETKGKDIQQILKEMEEKTTEK